MTTTKPLILIGPAAGWFDLRLSEAWEFRELLYFFVWRDLKVRYKQTAIGVGWAVLQPLFTMLVFTVFFGKLAKIPSAGLPYPVFYFAAILPWMYFANALGMATSTVVDNQRMITKVYFPKILLPVSAVVSGIVDLAIGLVLLAGMMLWYGITPSWAVLLIPLFVLFAVVTALAAGMWLSALNAIYRDVRYVIPFFIQFWMFASPVAYPSSLVPERWRWLYGLNPMAGVIEGFRWSVTGVGTPPGLLLAGSMVGVVLLLAGGLVYFQKMEGTLADVV